MRINKYLALKGYSTRRGADELIEKHQVLINGRFAVLGDKVESGDAVKVRSGRKPSDYVYYAYNKPEGVATIAPNKGAKGIKETIDLKNVFPIGRLDKNSHGLIILSNDGRITDRLLNPIHTHDKEYVVKVKDKLRNNFKEKMEAGVNIEGYVTKPTKIELIDETTFSVTLTEGKKHQIRRMVVALFGEVRDLKRIRIMNIALGKLAPNSYRKIEGEELKTFLTSLGLL
ncbi:MAG: Pseudouridine synthase [Parcubacteria group bacterium]|nr:Pseudouridine synthase [Parcubacteria group bacterium]